MSLLNVFSAKHVCFKLQINIVSGKRYDKATVSSKMSLFFKFALSALSEHTFLEHKDDTYFKMVGCWGRGGSIR
jgi:hypothetical protein